MKAKLFAGVQHFLPHHLISRAVHCFVESKIGWFKNGLIRGIANHYDVDMSEAQEERIEAYANFNEFFTRPLKDGARPLPEDPKGYCQPG